MLGRVSHRVLTLLQLTRMALVFTAISNGQAALLLGGRWPACAAAMCVTSVGLYGFGMTLNDVIDRRRDRQTARTRPLPSGRIGLAAACLVAGLLLALTFAAAWMLRDPVALTLAAATTLAIVAYDVGGKYLVWPGLLLLGLVRLLHALVADPDMTVAWHAMFLMNHVAVVSAVAYRWEAKRPPLTGRALAALAAGLVLLNATVVGYAAWRGGGFDLRAALLGPVLLAGLFVLVGRVIRVRSNDRRAAGKTLILYGLLWLILYDAAFVAGWVDWRAGAVLLMFWPMGWVAVRAMRAWGRVAEMAGKPQYVRSGA